ncbi:MAG: hypothetical protein FWC45_07580, partial [Treponema sp.]|nr:hypothetical protein [Treponema sp.]
MLVSNASWQYAKSANNYPQSPVPSPYSLYIHIPFCADRKCDYCDFYSTPVEGTEAGDPRLLHYVESILAEGERLFETYKPDAVPTVYIGGGTPSVLGPRLIRRLLSGLLKLITRTAPLALE